VRTGSARGEQTANSNLGIPCGLRSTPKTSTGMANSNAETPSSITTTTFSSFSGVETRSNEGASAVTTALSHGVGRMSMQGGFSATGDSIWMSADFLPWKSSS
jgi:hypothetical protein